MLKKYIKLFSLIIFLSVLMGQSGVNFTGMIVDASNNEPIPSANIQIMDTESGTVSDESGKFEVDWTGSLPFSLLISHIAYQPVEHKIDSIQFILIFMEPAVLMGEEVRITGVRSAAEKDVSSSVEIISLRQIEKRGMRDISEVLQEAGGVNVMTSTYGRQTASIRGSNANEVTVYLDGARLNRSWDGEANLAFVDMGDLQDVEVIRGGNLTLFGSGNFGGVILMKSRKLDHNYFHFTRSMGMSHHSDQDMSGSLSLKSGPLSVGGRMSGKSRLYDGRALYTTIFNNYASTFDNGKISASIRMLQHENYAEFISGRIISTDKMKIKQFDLSGDFLFTKGWEFQWGQKNWSWDDDFFINVSKSLRDSSSIIRLSKTFSFWKFSGTLMVEDEFLEYVGDNVYHDYSSRNWTDKTSLEREDKGWAGVFRFQQDNPVSDIDVFRVEFGLRNSDAVYIHDQNISVYDSTVLIDTIHYKFNETNNLRTTRLGMFMKGHTSRGNLVEFFFNQGTNLRLPTLEDYFLWGIGLEQMEDYYQTLERSNSSDLKLQDVSVVLTAMEGGLKHEFVSTTELSFNIAFNQLMTKPFTNWKFGFSVFRNSYLDKIAYREIPLNLSVPFNTINSWMNGIEIRGRTLIWDNQFQISGNMIWIMPSDELVFPETPSSRGNISIYFHKGIFHGNLSHLTQGPRKYMRGGVIFDQKKDVNNTNLTISLEKQIRFVTLQMSYAIRNLFSNESIVAETQNISSDGSFNYYDAHRQLLTLKISMAKDSF